MTYEWRWIRIDSMEKFAQRLVTSVLRVASVGVFAFTVCAPHIALAQDDYNPLMPADTRMTATP